MEKIYKFNWLSSSTGLVSAEKRIDQIISIISFLLIFLALIFIKNNPATGYEISIYASTPPLIWIFLIGSTLGGISIIVHQAFTEEKNNFWLIGFFILMLSIFNILTLHTHKGYFQYSAFDHMVHLQLMENIVETGHFEKGYLGNFYPVVHILGAQISEICNTSPNIVAKYFSPFLSIVFLSLFLYVLAKSSVLERGEILLACAASCVLFFNNLHIQIYPHTFSVLLFVPIIYLYFKTLQKPSWEFSLLFILMLILLPYTHPSGAITMIFLLMAMELGRFGYHKKYKSKGKSTIAMNPILISSITCFMWFSSFYLFGIKASSLWSSIFKPYESSEFIKLMETTTRLEWIEVVEFNLKMYGDSIIYIILASIAGAIIIKRFLNKEEETSYLFILFIFFLACIPIEYFFFIGVGSEKIGRVLNLLYMLTVAPVLVGFVLHELFKNKKRAVAIASVIIILASTFSISVFSVYHSPWTFSPSLHITKMDAKGSDWFLENYNSSLAFDGMGDPSLVGIGLIPEHFNYSNSDTLGKSLVKDTYVIINKRCKLANAEPMIAKTRINMASGWGFDEEDFDKLGNDPSVAKLYSNGEFDTFLVNSSNDGAWK